MTHSRSRVVPPDDVILAGLHAGRTLAQIARHHHISYDTLKSHALKHDLKASRQDDAPTTMLQETADKIIRFRNALTPGRDSRVIRIAISLPRIPTLHGDFAAASLSAAQGA